MNPPMKTKNTPDLDELDKFGHMYGDEVRENIIKHYVQKFHDHGGRATDSLLETKSWIGGTAGATTRQEKVEILARIRKTHKLV